MFGNIKIGSIVFYLEYSKSEFKRGNPETSEVEH